MTLSAEALIDKSLSLVSPPTTYNKVSSLLNDPHSSATDISTIISLDPALTARLLKIVNSAFYGFPSHIDTISRAITIIGTRELSHLILATSVIHAFKGIPKSLVDIDSFWRHSLACASAAKLLASQCGETTTERFFISGLLHNIGSLVLYQTQPELAKQAIQAAKNDNVYIFEAEKRLFGFDHTEVGQALVKAWHLPDSLETVVRYHHNPSKTERFKSEVAIIHIADIIVSREQLGLKCEHKIAPIDPDLLTLLNIEQDVLSEVVKQVTEQLDELTAVMTAS